MACVTFNMVYHHKFAHLTKEMVRFPAQPMMFVELGVNLITCDSLELFRILGEL